MGLGIAWTKAAQDISDFETALGCCRALVHVSLAGLWPHDHRLLGTGTILAVMLFRWGGKVES